MSSLTRNEQGVYLALGSDLIQRGQMGEHIRKFNELSTTAYYLSRQGHSKDLAKMITQFYPDIAMYSPSMR